jgi:uncharacterized protein
MVPAAERRALSRSLSISGLAVRRHCRTANPGGTMATTQSRKLFVNLAVRDLKRTKDFFSALGFQFNPQFTDENAACMIIGGDAYVMLLTEAFFKGFTVRELSDPRKATEALYALSCDSRDEVDELVTKAIAAGGAQAKPPQDHGFMYAWSFLDIDGHHWEVFWMNPSHVQ